MNLFLVLVLAFSQNVAFSMVSRARNRDSDIYHVAASVMSNGMWFLTIGVLDAASFGWHLAVPYVAGTVAGSLFGAKVSMRIERLLGAKT